jgi:hypothetical protein
MRQHVVEYRLRIRAAIPHTPLQCHSGHGGARGFNHLVPQYVLDELIAPEIMPATADSSNCR